jgi:hypothetical protein
MKSFLRALFKKSATLRKSSEKRRVPLAVESLEERLVPAGPYLPDQIRAAYGIDRINFGGVKGDGTGQTIAIVDAYNEPSIATDLYQFDSAEGVAPPSSFSVFNEGGHDITNLVISNLSTNVVQGVPGVDPAGPGAKDSWEEETALDVEWAHAIAPEAAIDQIECNSPSRLLTGAATAANLPGVSVVSLIWGGGEFRNELAQGHFSLIPTAHATLFPLVALGCAGERSPDGFAPLSAGAALAACCQQMSSSSTTQRTSPFRLRQR